MSHIDKIIQRERLIGNGVLPHYGIEELRALLQEVTEEYRKDVERLRRFAWEVASYIEKPMYMDKYNRMGCAEDCKSVARNTMDLSYLDADKFAVDAAIAAEGK